MNVNPMGMSQQLPQYNLGALQQQINALSQQAQAMQQMICRSSNSRSRQATYSM